jgi:hypothetical protein
VVVLAGGERWHERAPGAAFQEVPSDPAVLCGLLPWVRSGERLRCRDGSHAHPAQPEEPKPLKD